MTDDPLVFKALVDRDDGSGVQVSADDSHAYFLLRVSDPDDTAETWLDHHEVLRLAVALLSWLETAEIIMTAETAISMAFALLRTIRHNDANPSKHNYQALRAQVLAEAKKAGITEYAIRTALDGDKGQ